MNEKEALVSIGKFLKTQKTLRDFVLYLFYISTEVSFEKMVHLQVKDIKQRDFIFVNKDKKIRLNSELKKAIGEYVTFLQDEDYLFSSKDKKQPLSRSQGWKIISDAKEAVESYYGTKIRLTLPSMRSAFQDHFMSEEELFYE